MNWQLWTAAIALGINIPFYGFAIGRVRTQQDAIVIWGGHA